MKKNFFVKTVAMTLATVMAMGSSAFAAPADVANTLLTGTNTTLMDMVLPSTVTLAVDPFEKATALDDGQGGQIASPNYYMVNEGISEAVITVEATLKDGTLKDGVTLVSSIDELDMDDMDIESEDKRFTLGFISAKSISSTIATPDTPITTPIATYKVFGRYDDENVASIQYMNEEGLKSRFVTERATKAGKSFALEPQATAYDALSTFTADTLGTNGISAFKFYGNVNTYADWKAADFSVEFVVDYTGVRPEAYADVNVADGTTGLLTEIGFVKPTMEVTKAAIVSPLAALKINVPASYKVAYVLVNDVELAAAKYSYTGKALTLTDALGVAATEVGTEFVVVVGFADKYGNPYEEEAVAVVVVTPNS